MPKQYVMVRLERSVHKRIRDLENFYDYEPNISKTISWLVQIDEQSRPTKSEYKKLVKKWDAQMKDSMKNGSLRVYDNGKLVGTIPRGKDS